MHDGNCSHGIPLDEPCLLCLSEDREGKPRDVRMPTTFELNVRAFVYIMDRACEWLTADIVISRLGDRLANKKEAAARTYIRHLAKGSDGRVMSGQLGYKSTKRSTLVEVNAASSALMKAAQGCMDRRSDILHVFHHGRPRTEQERITENAKG